MKTIFTDRWSVYLDGLKQANTPCMLLETGRIHDSSDAYFYGDGASTLLFANQSCIEKVYSVDINPDSERVCKYIIGEAAERVVFINEDSIRALPALGGKYFGVILLDSAEDPVLNVMELVLCVKYNLMDTNTVLLLDDIDTKSKYIMNLTQYYDTISKNDRCAAIKIFDLEHMIAHLNREILGGH